MSGGDRGLCGWEGRGVLAICRLGGGLKCSLCAVELKLTAQVREVDMCLHFHVIAKQLKRRNYHNVQRTCNWRPRRKVAQAEHARLMCVFVTYLGEHSGCRSAAMVPTRTGEYNEQLPS